jgi:antirestriction protein ArdC
MASRDIYQEVTDRIISALDEGTVPWRRPWREVGQQRNLQSGRPYRGINQVLLSLSGYESPYWTTFRAAQKAGGAVRKGEHGSLVVLWKFARRREIDPETGEAKTHTYPMLRHYVLFNVEQTDGLEVPEPEDVEPVDPLESGEAVIAGYPNPPKIGIGGDSAFYMPAVDHVQLPPRDAFDSADAYYHTAFHELAHSTGHKSRLNRPDLNGAMAADSYSREELTAELGASFLCGEAGIDPDIPRSSAYVDHWRRKLSEDKKLVVQAAGRAQRAADWILDRQFEPENGEDA